MNVTLLKQLKACEPAVKWASQQKSRQQAWDACPRGDWLLWLLIRTCEPKSKRYNAVALTACKCARLAFKYRPRGENRPVQAVRAVERWVAGKISTEELNRKWSGNCGADYVGTAVASCVLLCTAAHLDDSCLLADYASCVGLYAADAAAASDISPVDGKILRAKMQRECAAVIRKRFPRPPTIRQAKPKALTYLTHHG